MKWTDSKLLQTYQDFKIYVQEHADTPINAILEAGLDKYNRQVFGNILYLSYTVIVRNQCGKIIAGLISSTAKMDNQKFGNSTYIQTLWVDKDYQHQGLEKILIYQLMQYACSQNSYSIYLDVYGYSQHSKEFFEAMGFVEVATIPGPNEDIKYQCSFMRLMTDSHHVSHLCLNSNHSFNISSYESELSKRNHSNVIQKISQKYHADIAVTVGIFDQKSFTIFVILPSGKIVGGAICTITQTSDIQFCYVHTVWVHEKYRAQKLGTKIMEIVALHAKAKDCTHVYLDTATWQARPFYEKLGFDVIATVQHPKQYSEYEQWFMRKSLL